MANRGGQPQYRRQLAGEVRDLTLQMVKDILLDNEHKVYTEDFRGQVILKLAGNVLPRVNEITGEDGEVLQIVVKHYGDKDESNTTTQVSG